jgi:hypothetical protein
VPGIARQAVGAALRVAQAPEDRVRPREDRSCHLTQPTHVLSAVRYRQIGSEVKTQPRRRKNVVTPASQRCSRRCRWGASSGH